MKQLILGLTAGMFLSGAALANEPAAAAATQPASEKAAACAACHGPNGVSANPIYPSLAGQYADYLETALKAYKSGARKNPVMAGMAAPLSDQDIKALAGYFAAQKGPLYTPALK
ncbi:MAG: c-type cytochrome [Nevskiales bacterium]